MKIIGYYTIDTPYENEYYEVKKNFDQYGLDYQFYSIKNEGRWELNCGMKASILRQALSDFDDNILYLDVDARILRQPPFEEIETDLPGYIVFDSPWQKQQLASGTIYFPNNDVSRSVIDDWIEDQTANPMMWDQVTLKRVYKNTKHSLIDYKWCNILGHNGPQSRILETNDPVVLHTQVSRKYKAALA